jgi:hypothetical protein
LFRHVPVAFPWILAREAVPVGVTPGNRQSARIVNLIGQRRASSSASAGQVIITTSAAIRMRILRSILFLRVRLQDNVHGFRKLANHD